jgi:hypothetical protein
MVCGFRASAAMAMLPESSKIDRLFRLSRVLQALLKTSVDLRSDASASVSRLRLLGLISPVKSIGRAMSGNARATCFAESRFHCERVVAICVA